MTTAYNIDCMEYMKTLPDKSFDLAVVDPPYGDPANYVKQNGENGDIYIYDKSISHNNLHQTSNYKNVERTGGTWAAKYGKAIEGWDIAPPPEYFRELFRVSKNQIIWGGNYFMLPPTRCFLVWKKLTISEKFSMAMAEYAWTSFNSNAKVFECAPQGNPNDPRFHPTQKPIALYQWIMGMFAKPGDKILDTHLGSGSSRIAADEYGLDFVGCEIDKFYFDQQEKRFKDYSQQLKLF